MSKSKQRDDKTGWEGGYLHGVTAAEVELALSIKIPPRASTIPIVQLNYRPSAKKELRGGSISSFLMDAFSWRSTKEGVDYWDRQHRRAKGMNSIPIINQIRKTGEFKPDLLGGDPDSWEGWDMGGVSVAEVEEALWIKFPPRSQVSILNDIDCPGRVSALHKNSLAECIQRSFKWDTSREGSAYWSNHCERAKMLDSVEVVTKLREAKKLSKGGVL